MGFEVKVYGGAIDGPGVTYVRVLADSGALMREWTLYSATPRALKKAMKKASEYRDALEDVAGA